jgi:hypothetical protein
MKNRRTARRVKKQKRVSKRKYGGINTNTDESFGQQSQGSLHLSDLNTDDGEILPTLSLSSYTTAPSTNTNASSITQNNTDPNFLDMTMTMSTSNGDDSPLNITDAQPQDDWDDMMHTPSMNNDEEDGLTDNETMSNSFNGGKKTRKVRKHKKHGKSKKITKKYRKSRHKKQKGGIVFGNGIGANCADPNNSIYNTNMLKLFPYRPN